MPDNRAELAPTPPQGALTAPCGPPAAALRRSHRAGEVHRPERSWPRVPAPGPVQLSPPPTAPDRGQGGLLAVLAPLVGSLSMVAFVFVVHSLAYLVMVGVMVLATAGGSLATPLVQRRRARRRWTTVRARYLRHLEDVERTCARAAEDQRAALERVFPDPGALLERVRRLDGIWERRPGDPDFCAVRLGLGKVRAACPAAMGQPGGPLAESDPELSARAGHLVDNSRELEDAPVVVPLATLGTVAVIGSPSRARSVVGAWIASLAAFHAPGELRVAGLFPAAAAPAWDWLKWLPHTIDPSAGDGPGRAVRAVTTDAAVFSRQVQEILQNRSETGRRAHAIVVVDGWRAGSATARVPGLEALMEGAGSLGATVIVLVQGSGEIPSTCGSRVELALDGTAACTESGPGGRVERAVGPDLLDPGVAAELARRLAPLRAERGDGEAAETGTVRLVELLGGEDPRGLDIGGSWARAADRAGRPAAALLQAPVGRRREGEPVILDLREAAEGGMGPHGMLVGATGSGKSELLRSLVTALAARHPPELLNFLLVDFKGGAAFAGLAGLPHVAGLVTNLAGDLELVGRVRRSLHGELQRRQELLRAAGCLDSIRQHHGAGSGAAAGPEMAYLLIVVDEFGELLAARPDLLDTFLAVARLGRSLGMHLLLSSQRLDEGRIRGLESHLRYRLALRTYTAAESRAVLGSPAAFELPAVPGLGYLQVDGRLERFRAGLVTLPCLATEAPGRRRAAPPMVAFGLTPAGGTSAAPAPIPTAATTDLEVLVGRIGEAADERRARRIWLEPLPDAITLGQVRERFPEPPAPGPGSGVADPTCARPLRASIGVLDLPERQAQLPLVLDLAGPGGNLGVAGAPQTGKSTILRSVVLSLCTSRSPAEVQVYCLDLGGGGLFGLARLPHVGAVVGRGEPEAAGRLLRELRALVDERANLFRQLGASSLEDLRSPARAGAGSPLATAHVVCVVDNVGLLRQSLPDLEPVLGELAASGLQYGIHVVVAANRWLDVRPQLLDSLGSRLELRLGDPADSGVSRGAAASLPSARPGRGLTRDGDLFQAALPILGTEPLTDERSALAEAVELATRSAGGLAAPALSRLPERIRAGEVAGLAAAAGSPPPSAGAGFLLGVAEVRCTPVQLDLLAPGGHLLAVGDGGSGRTTLLRRAARHLMATASPGRVRLHVVDPGRGLLELAGQGHVEGYAATPAAAEKLATGLAAALSVRLPPEELDPDQLRFRSWWHGPDHVLVVDDYDLVLTSGSGPFGALVDLLGMAADIGFHVLLARRASGAQRSSFEPFWQRLREVGAHGMLLSGPPDEGPLLGGLTPRPQPPGRGHLVTGRARASSGTTLPTAALVQCCIGDEGPASGAGPGAGPALAVPLGSHRARSGAAAPSRRHLAAASPGQRR